MSLKGNCIIGQSGGPTSVINASLYGVIREAEQSADIGRIYGALHGVEGMIGGNVVDLECEQKAAIEGLRYTPGAALGGCRYMLSSDDPADRDMLRILDLLERLDIRYLFYIGGNDSMDTALKIHQACRRAGREIRVMGIPKTVDNDLPCTHHCPGYGSAAKYIAASVREAWLHAEAMQTCETVTVLVTVGRNTGWLPAASALARNAPDQAPHIICFPEISFDTEVFLARVDEIHQRVGGVFIVTGEGLTTASGDYVAARRNILCTDAFGHPELGGVGEYLKELIESKLGLHTRVIKPDICQQAAMHFASATDRDEAILVGREAVRRALAGESGRMVTLAVSTDGEYRVRASSVDLNEVANVERQVPREMINEAGDHVTKALLDYVRPLIQGEVQVPLINGLPDYVRLGKIRVPLR